MTGVKTNERPGTRAVAKYLRVSPYKVREVLDLVRGQHVQRASEILRFSERDAAFIVGKVLASAVANAENNDGLDPEDLYVSACYADEGVTIKRFRPRARGRAGRIRKRTCHVTVIVSRMDDETLRRYRTKQAAEQAARRARRVAGGRASAATPEGGGRASRLRRNRGAASPAETDSLAAAGDEAQVEAVDEVAAAADEAGVVENSPETGADTEEETEVAPAAASDEGAESAEDEGRG